MQTPPTPVDERRRLDTLRALDVLDSEPEERFENCTALVDAMFAAPGATPTEPTVAAVAAPAPPAHDPTAVLPPRPPVAAPDAAPPALTTSVGRSHTMSGAMKAMWVVFALLIAVPIGFLAMPGDDAPDADRATVAKNEDAPPAAGEIGAHHSPKPPPGEDPGMPPAMKEHAPSTAKDAASLAAPYVGRYDVDRTALEKTLREARSRHARTTRKGMQWGEAERALKGGMTLELREDFTFTMTPPARPGKPPVAVEGRWQKLDDSIALKVAKPAEGAPRRGPSLFELRILANGRLVLQTGKIGIPLNKQ